MNTLLARLNYKKIIFETQTMIEDMPPIFTKACADFEAELIEFDGEHDHVHLLIIR
ncbi:transposase [Thorsellia anophelis]|uniref:transposase n=1 Tax=Thorsellia anophelis TaxID=336804 RepID=UPI003CCC3511